MSFLSFCLYFIGSMLVWKVIQIGFYLVYKKYMNYKFQKAVKDGKVKFVTIDDIFENKKEDGTWH